MDGDQLPKFDHSKKWNVRPDRPPRRKINYNQVEDPLSMQRPAEKHQLSRQNNKTRKKSQ